MRIPPGGGYPDLCEIIAWRDRDTGEVKGLAADAMRGLPFKRGRQEAQKQSNETATARRRMGVFCAAGGNPTRSRIVRR